MNSHEPALIALAYAGAVFFSAICFSYLLWLVIGRISKALQIVIPILGAAAFSSSALEFGWYPRRFEAEHLLVPILIGFGLSLLMLYFRLHAEVHDLRNEVNSLKKELKDAGRIGGKEAAVDGHVESKYEA